MILCNYFYFHTPKEAGEKIAKVFNVFQVIKTEPSLEQLFVGNSKS